MKVNDGFTVGSLQFAVRGLPFAVGVGLLIRPEAARAEELATDGTYGTYGTNVNSRAGPFRARRGFQLQTANCKPLTANCNPYSGSGPFISARICFFFWS